MYTTKRIHITAIAAMLLAAIVLSLAIQSASATGYQIGDIVTFGTYEQDNNRRNGAEDIEWIVIDQEDDRIMLISKDCLDSMPYHDTLEPINWEYCSLRQWLNTDFLKTAFTEEERSRIVEVTNENPEHERAKTSSGRSTVDRVFILSREEAQKLFSTYASRKAAPTNYAVAQGAYQNENNLMGWWWLRTTSYMLDHVTYATSGGDVSSEGRQVTRQDAGVRPVIWVTADEIVRETDAGDKYWSETLSYGFSLQEGWSFDDSYEFSEGKAYGRNMEPQELEARLNTGEYTDDMLAISHNREQLGFARVSADKIDLIEDEETYSAFHELTIASATDSEELTDVVITSGNMVFLGDSHPWILYTAKMYGIDAYVKSVHVRQGDYMMTFTAFSAFQDFTDDILSNFYTVNS